jgi:hypothetical protein
MVLLRKKDATGAASNLLRTLIKANVTQKAISGRIGVTGGGSPELKQIFVFVEGLH